MRYGLAFARVWMDVKETYLKRSPHSLLLDGLEVVTTAYATTVSLPAPPLLPIASSGSFPTQHPRHPLSSEQACRMQRKIRKPLSAKNTGL